MTDANADAHRMMRAKELAQQIPNNCDDNIPRKVEELARSIVDLMADAPHNIIAAGTQITCENGHHIMSAKNDVSLLKPQDVSNWSNWQQPEPALGDFLPLTCAKCGAEWMRMSRDKRVQYHTEEGWRP